MKKSFYDVDAALAFEERMKAKGFITIHGLKIEKLQPVMVVWVCEESELMNSTNVRRA